MEKNYYDILEVNKNASPEIIEKAYKTLVKKYHPDLQDNNLKAEYEEKIKLINEAFEVLSDSEKRKNYDLNLKQTEFSVEDYNNLINENLKLKNEINYLKNTLINYKNNIINNLRNKKIKMYCLSGMKFSFHLKAKQTFIDKYYGNDIEVISTSEQELKLKGIRVLAKLNNCKLTEILFVDDNLDVIALLEKNGVKAIHVDNIS